MTNHTDYGIDAPPVVVAASAVGLVAVLLALVLRFSVPLAPYWPLPLLAGIIYLVLAAGFLASSKVGKLRLRDWTLEAIDWRGDEQVLDVGCGKGLLLIGAAKHLTTGKAIGVDIWRTTDQTGHSPAATISNARAEGVEDRVDVRDGDARDLPFESSSFDVVLSGLVLHNLSRDEKPKAIREMVRVLKPGGKLAIFDTWRIGVYAKELRSLQMDEVRFSVPFPLFLRPTRILTARKPIGPSAR